ncbi:hypothetical protein M2D07_021470 [Pseudomonas sp. BGr12]|uniref:hypothetical protein n=2 Tax=Pseudomonas TaxID=286 RepID=UPI002559567B|nr:hypothetical protein [Pseudomonas sp. BJa5]MDL2429599.1 hypothetical protein [Pseudomonas sp. BJa5]
MQLKPLIATLLIGTAALAGCKQEHNATTAQIVQPQPSAATNSVERSDIAGEGVRLNLPALPIIRNAVFSLVPTINGQRDGQIMAQACGLARGELTQGQVNTVLAQRGVDPAKLPRTGSPLSMLVNGDKASQTTACAAYLASSVLLAPDASEYTKSVTVPVKPADPKSKAKVVANPATQISQVDPAALARVLPMKLAQARANADVFALIASELQTRPGLSLGGYRNEAMQLFARLAPVYLQRIRMQMPGQTVRFDVVRLDGGALIFNGSDGSRFEFDGANLRLVQNDVLWFGEGKLMGQDYVLPVAYFDASVKALVAPTKP